MSHSSAPTPASTQPSPSDPGRYTASSHVSRDSRVAVPENATPRSLHGSTALPSLATITAGSESLPTSSPTTWRAAGLHSLLNPSDTTSSTSSHNQARNSQLTDGRTVPAQPISVPPAFASPRGRKRGDSFSPSVDGETRSTAPLGRRMLTPRSPSARAASLGMRRSPSRGSAPGHRVPLPGAEGRGYTVEPGTHGDSSVPPLPPLPVTRNTLPAIQTSGQDERNYRPPMLIAPLSASSGQPLLAGNAPASATGYGGQRPPSPTPAPPSSRQQTQASPILSSGLNAGGQPGFSSMHGPGLPRQSGWKIALDTHAGTEVVDINIDYQQASRLADEKRKRNAGASARFRARRKEKEKESSQMISGLQQDLREMTEERDFYHNERNFFRDLVSRSNGGAVPARPPSPHTRPSHAASHTISDSSSVNEYGRRESVDMSMPRRPTGDYQPSYNHSPSPSTYKRSFSGLAAPYHLQTPSHPGPYAPDIRTPGPAPPLTPTPALAPVRPQDMDGYRRDHTDHWHPRNP